MTTAQKTQVQQTWSVSKIQEEGAASVVRHMLATFRVLEKVGPEAATELQNAFAQVKLDYYKSHGVETPLDLVKVMSEFETNVFGSKISYTGNDKQAVLEYETCGCWNAMGKTDVKPTEQEKMGKNCAASTEKLAKEFGFKSEVKVSTNPGEPCCTITFTK